MATMYPRRLASGSTNSTAEERLFELFEKHLNNRFSVFHSRSLLAKDAQNNILEKEIDFLIAHPDHGLLALEVKGGAIFIDGTTGQWHSIDRNSVRHPIKNPAMQAQSAIHALMDHHIRQNPKTRSYQYPFGYAVALPDTPVTHDIDPSLPRVLTLDQNDARAVAALQSVIERMMQHWKGTRRSPGPQAIAALAQVVAPSHFFRSMMATDFEDESEQIKELTDDQYEVLDERLEGAKRYLITGCAGSGKTVLALEKAKRLANAGKQVLYVCYNDNLATFLRDRVTQDAVANIEIRTFHSLCYSLLAKLGQNLPHSPQNIKAQFGDVQSFYDYVLPGKLLDMLDKVTSRFDAIIADEGQDFRRAFWQPLQGLLRDPQASAFLIFCDDSQRIYSHDALPFDKPHYHLKKNLRNVKPIGDLVSGYRRGVGDYVAAGPESGRKIEIIDLARSPNKLTVLKDILDDLTAEKVPLDHIILLTPRGEGSFWHDRMTIGDYTLVRSIQHPGGKQLCLETIQGFKGLERPVVILAELDQLPAYIQTDEDSDNLLYVALSRAKNHLIILGTLPKPRK